MTQSVQGATAPGAPPGGWPVEEYDRNEGTVGQKQITFIGASYKFVHKVLRDMLLVGGFNDVHLVVHDIDPEPMNIVADLLEKIARQQKSNVKVSRTTNLDEALKGADAVVLSITTGGREADERSWEICINYGIPVGVGDTLGPAAFARNLRTIPVVVDLVKKMEKICPKAIMLNFTNPMSALTCAMARYSSIPTFGLCHSADEMFRFFAEVFGVKKKDVKLEVGGVNHQSFVTRVWIKGEDRTADMLSAIEASDVKFQDTLLDTREEEIDLQKDIFRILKAWPSTGDTHLAEFYEYFYTPRRIHRFQQHGHGLRKIKPGRKPYGNTKCPDIIREWTYGPEPVGDLHLLTTEHAHEILWAWWTGQPFTRVLNVLNDREYLKGIPRDACVEALVTIEKEKISGEQIQLPPAINSLVHRWTTIHDLSIKAAMECDRDAAMQALFLDPHVTDMYDIPQMLDDFLNALEPWLPRGWFKTTR